MTGAETRNVAALSRRLGDAFSCAEENVRRRFRDPVHPTFLIVGSPRAGSTILLQLLAASNRIGFPSNLLARFYLAPYTGAHVQSVLTHEESDLGGECVGGRGGFESIYGKTRGALQPSEFYHFWRRFVPLQHPQRLTANQRSRVDASGLRAGIAAIEYGLGRPVAMKALLVQFELEVVARAIPGVVFIRLHRDPVETANSMLRARRSLYGDEAQWWSVRPPGWRALLGRPASEQVAGQVHLTGVALDRQLAALARPVVHFSLDRFVTSPRREWRALAADINEHGVDCGPLPMSREAIQPMTRASAAVRKKLEAAFASVEKRLP